jgi:hypothetical protein
VLGAQKCIRSFYRDTLVVVYALTHLQGAKSASAKAASKVAGEDEGCSEADAKAIADAKETSRGGAAAAKVRVRLLCSIPPLAHCLCEYPLSLDKFVVGMHSSCDDFTS